MSRRSLPDRVHNLLVLRTEALRQFRIAFRSGNGSAAEELRVEIERLEAELERKIARV